MLKIGEFFMIRELYQKGWTQTAIAKETGFDRKTIRKYLKGDIKEIYLLYGML
jgi:transposase